MKKFFKSLFTCFIILVIFGGAVFFLGWTQIRVSPNSIGILKSKTSGVLKEPVYPGKFSWHWEFLLPTNVDFQTYELKPYSEQSVIAGVLPSGEVYSSIAGEKINFSYSFNFDFTANVKPEAIVSLVSNVYISDQESLEKYVKSVCESAAKMISSEIVKKAESDISYYPATLSGDEIKSMVDLKTSFPYVEFSSITLTSVTFPDVALYNKAREIYLSRLPDASGTIKSEKSEAKASGQPENSDKDLMVKLRQLFNAEQE